MPKLVFPIDIVYKLKLTSCYYDFGFALSITLLALLTIKIGSILAIFRNHFSCLSFNAISVVEIIVVMVKFIP
jgi:hypothetical protein